MQAQWDAFVDGARNATFLFRRNYMDYHSDRFADCSLMLLNRGKLLALLPANIRGDTLYSHQGLTYGGLVADHHLTASLAIEAIEAVNDWLRHNTLVRHVVYKPVPWIYHTMPAEEDLYAIIQVCQARIVARDISTCLDLHNMLRMQELRRRCIKKAIKARLSVRETDDIDTFWRILNNNLTNKYGVHPVHSADELRLLKSRFPDNIRLFMAYTTDDIPLGGILAFDMPSIVHTQYISASPEGKALGAIDLVVQHIISWAAASHRYLDFGKSTEQEGRYLNRSLIFQKEGFGGRGVCYDTYQWDVYDD